MADEPNTNNKAAFSRSKIGGETPMVVGIIADRTLYSGFFGILDSARMQIIIERILDNVVQTESDFIIIDLGNVEMIDSAVAARLFKVADAIKTIGAEAIFCGIRPLIAQTMVETGASLENLRTRRDLRSALRTVYAMQGKDLVQKDISYSRIAGTVKCTPFSGQ